MATQRSKLISELNASWRNAIDVAVDAAFGEMVEVRQHLHAHPEPSGEEFETTRYIVERLDPDTFDLAPGPEGRGVTVQRKGELTGSRIVLRADIDALRIQDNKNVAYRSTRNGIMHACGHDGHSAVILGAIRALTAAQADGSLPHYVPWRAVFQPAEESNEGALAMIRAGVLENARAIIGLHLDPSREVGGVGVRSGTFTSDCVEIRMRIAGKGGHAARPHESLDPIATAAQLISSIYLFVPRTSDSNDPIVVSFGQIHGGTSSNVIPDEVRLSGTLRTHRAATRVKTIDHINKLSRSLAEASDTRIEIEYIEGPPALQNDPDLTALIASEATDVVSAARVDTIPHPSMGGEDFANYTAHVPGAMFRLGCASPGRGAPPLHSPDFDLDPESLRIGAKILARVAVAWSEQQAAGKE